MKLSKELQNQRLIELLHACTQKGYRISFSNDFEGMITLGYEIEWEENTYNHEHLGCPGHDLKLLETQVRHALNFLLEKE